jgi:predicted N-acetyltransferase YhbS
MRVCARPARTHDWDAMLNVIRAANPHLQDRIERFRAAATPWHDATPIVVCERSGIGGATVIFRRCVRTRAGKKMAGGIGAVATHPAFRNRGLASAAIRTCEEILRAEGYPFAILFCSIVPFYERLGWRVVPDQVAPLPVAGDDSLRLEVAPLDLTRDWSLLADVYQRADSGAIERNADLWREYSTWMREDPGLLMGAFREGRLVAYSRGRLGSSGLEVLEAPALPSYEGAIPLLLERQAAKAGAARAPVSTTHMMTKKLRTTEEPPAQNDWLTFSDSSDETPWSPRVWWPIDRF